MFNTSSAVTKATVDAASTAHLGQERILMNAVRKDVERELVKLYCLQTNNCH